MSIRYCFLSVVVGICGLLPFSAGATVFTVQEDVVGNLSYYQVQEKDNLYEIARRHDIGIVELLAANPGVDPWTPQPGTQLTIVSTHLLPPGVREGIVINLSELRLFYFTVDKRVMSFPIGIGQQGWPTPVGTTTILRKRAHPVWTPPPSIRAENPDLPYFFPPGPDNPLGDYALDLGMKGILIHGTNRPYGVGKRSSHGCIRLYPEDMALLFANIDVDTQVTIIDVPYKLGWQGQTLFLEMTPSQSQTDDIAEYREAMPFSIPEIYDAISTIAGEKTLIRWYDVEEAIAERNGIPVAIGTRD